VGHAVTAGRPERPQLGFGRDQHPQRQITALAALARRRTRCVVPFTSFSENEALPDGRKPPVWFAFDETRLLAFFAGLWTNWTSVRRVKEGETTNDLFGFLTTEPNKEVGVIHPKAMPVILTTRPEIDLWMTAPVEDALKLQRPLADGALSIVARGGKEDEGGLTV
jgi:putative SOS response-associated peptidase YedK